MIKLERPQIPAELTPAKQKELTDTFKENNNKAVWNKDWIKRPLRRMSDGKCAFSEMKLDEEGKYMQVEHFHPKSRYPDEVVEWDNLLPICNFCNIQKGEFDTKAHPLVDPTIDNPKDYFYVKRGRLWPKDTTNAKAVLTIDKYKLNDYQQFVSVRRRIEIDLDERLNDIAKGTELDLDYNISKLKKLLRRCTRRASYSAIRATFVLGSLEYQQLKDILVSKDLWDREFRDLECELTFCALPKK